MELKSGQLKLLPKILWIILCVTFFSYVRVLNAEFVNFDDDVMVYNNSLITSLSWENISAYFSGPVAGIYQPLTMLSLSLDHAVAGMSPNYFHFINLIIHLINVLLVFRLVKALSGSEMIALTVAALFGVHTIHVESVAWVTARKDVLFGLFYLLGLIKFVRYTEGQDKKQLLWTFVFFIMACLAKPIAVSFTLILPLIHYYKGAGMKEWWSLKNWLTYVPFLVVSLFFGVMIYLDQKENIPDNNTLFQGWSRQIVFAGDAITSYLNRTVLPINLSVIYNYPAEKGEPIPITAISMAVFAFIWVALSIWLLFKNKALAFGSLFFLFNIMFVLQLVPMGVGYQADRFMYIPVIGLFWMMAVGVRQLIVRKKVSLSNVKYGVGVYALLLSLMTLIRTGDWQDGMSLWDATISTNPDSYIAYNNRGELFMESMQWYDAINDFTKSIVIKENEKAYYNRGTSFANLAQWKNAEIDLIKAIQMDTTNGEAFGNLGVVYMNTMNDSMAFECLIKAVQLEPENPVHQNNLNLLKSFQ